MNTPTFSIGKLLTKNCCHNRRWIDYYFYPILAFIFLMLPGCAINTRVNPVELPLPNIYLSENIDLAIDAGGDAPQQLVISNHIATQWWELFHSEQLNMTVKKAISGNLKFEDAQYTLAQSQELLKQSLATLWPQASVTANAEKMTVTGPTAGITTTIAQYNLYTIGPTVQYMFDIFGLQKSQLNRSRAITDAQEYQVGATYLALCGNVVNQALAIASLQEQIKIILSIIEDDERNVQNLKFMLEYGRATKIDLAQTMAQLTADQTLLPSLKEELSVAQHALIILVGVQPEKWTTPDFRLNDFTLPDKLPLSVPSELVHQRPDILYAEAQMRIAEANIGVANAEMYPMINLSGTFLDSGNNPSLLFNAVSGVWNLTGQLTATIFDHGALASGKRAAEDAFKGTQSIYKETVLNAFIQVANTLTSIRNDADLVARAHRSLEAAQRC